MSSEVPGDTTGSRTSPDDLLVSASPGRTATWWASLSPSGRHHLRLVGLLAVVLVPLGLAGAAARDWWTERSLRNAVEVEASLGVSSSSTGPYGGRVDYYAVVRNAAPRPARLIDVRVAQSRLRVTGRPGDDEPVAPGDDVYVRLSVELDCAREEPLTTGGVLHGSVGVVTTGGTATRAPVSFVRADPLTSVADTLCEIDPGLRIAEMSGPVSGGAQVEGPR